MHADQAIYTSLPRDGHAGYHLVSRSAGVTDDEARALAAWSPSHGALLIDPANRASVNFHPLPGGRHALSRSCEGRPEYSGRGGRQVYTHALILDARQIEAAGSSPLAIYRDALSRGLMQFRPDPPPGLDRIALAHCHRPADPDGLARRLGPLPAVDLADVRRRLAANEPVTLRFQGDRAGLAEWFLALTPRALRPAVSFSTSLAASSSRPYRLTLLG